jgi:dTDP-4-amino-4,6-dideoxygalactose transaminase
MWVRKRIDMGWCDLLSGVVHCLIPGHREAAVHAVEAAWSSDGRACGCLSVRSGLDLALTALELPAGSEILVSAMTIPDMVRIIAEHGLVAVPVDLQRSTAFPQLDLLEKLVTPQTKAILVAHLFGGRSDLAPIVEFAQAHDLLVFEDCAQAFEGRRYLGHEQADVSMFSFGPIKTATALGGGVLRVRDARLLERMRQVEAEYPVQSRWFFMQRLLFYCLLTFLGGKIVFGLFVRMCRLLRKDLDALLNGSISNFPGDQFFASLRQQPSLPLLRLLRRRITGYREQDLDLRAARGALLARALPAERCPGAATTPHSFWIFPLQVDEPSTVITNLRNAGFDATSDNSLQPVEAPATRPEVDAMTARGLLERVIFLPLYAAMPESEVQRMTAVLLPLLDSGRAPAGE